MRFVFIRARPFLATDASARMLTNFRRQILGLGLWHAAPAQAALGSFFLLFSSRTQNGTDGVRYRLKDYATYMLRYATDSAVLLIDTVRVEVDIGQGVRTWCVVSVSVLGVSTRDGTQSVDAIRTLSSQSQSRNLEVETSESLHFRKILYLARTPLRAPAVS
jgi:hypothetical protein